MQLNSGQIKDLLLSSIDSLQKDREAFLANSQSDFTRTKKISFAQTILFPMIAGSDNVATELMDFFDETKLPDPSSMIQRRNQVKPDAFKALFSMFTKQISVVKTFHGYQLVACDGSRINLPYNPSDPDTFIQCIKNRKGINQIHMNSLYDILSDVFLDVEIQGIHKIDEQGAFCRFLSAESPSSLKRIFLADRGYASYNVFAHALHSGHLFLIRVPKDFADSLYTGDKPWLESPSEDRDISIHIGRRRTKANSQLENYHCVPSRRRYDFLEAGSDKTDLLRLRVLKFPISEDSYEYIVTNLPKYQFTEAKIKELYNLRWGIETAFRHLKYAGNMVHIHSLKREFLIQEIYGKLTMYNFSSFIAAAVGREQKNTEKYTYVLNHTQAQKICVRFLKGRIENVADLICRYLVPVRKGRKFERNIRRQSADTLTYR